VSRIKQCHPSISTTENIDSELRDPELICKSQMLVSAHTATPYCENARVLSGNVICSRKKTLQQHKEPRATKHFN
jgi:hypothetical protein